MSAEHLKADSELVLRMCEIVGNRNVLLGKRKTRPYRTGYRFGGGMVIAVVRPKKLIDLWRVAQLCVEADVSIIVQAANTGLTGGSTPQGEDYPNGVVLISTTRIKGIHLLDQGRQAICLPGARLHELEGKLSKFDREPHSVIGSSCIGASVIGGICNNSGGALVRRGPAYTKLALFGRVSKTGELELVNHLGITLQGPPEAILEQVEQGKFDPHQIVWDEALCASDHEYDKHVRDIGSPTPARFNADRRRLFEASGSAGKLIIFAVRLDTYPREANTRTFYIGTNDADELTSLRRDFLTQAERLPIRAEYLDKASFELAGRYGKDAFLIIRHLGTAFLPGMLLLKSIIDVLASALGAKAHFADRVLQQLAATLPYHLRGRVDQYGKLYQHQLLLTVSSSDIQQTRALLGRLFPSAAGNFFECSKDEASKAFLNRFVAASAALRYCQMNSGAVGELLSLDVALPRNTLTWIETLPDELENCIALRLCYGHFFCHVFHRDYVLRCEADCAAVKERLLERLNEDGAEYPAEHNVGHLYPAKPALEKFYRTLDPRNQLNPGIGRTTRKRNWESNQWRSAGFRRGGVN